MKIDRQKVNRMKNAEVLWSEVCRNFEDMKKRDIGQSIFSYAVETTDFKLIEFSHKEEESLVVFTIFGEGYETSISYKYYLEFFTESKTTFTH